MDAPYIKWYPKDIISSARVAEMDIKVEGWYRRALDYCWINKSLPADPAKLARVIGKGCTYKVCREMIIPMFSVHPGDETKLIHKRQEDERDKIVTISGKKRHAADVRWSKRNADASAPALQKDMQVDGIVHGSCNAIHSHSTDTDTQQQQNDQNARSAAVAAGLPEQVTNTFLKPIEGLAALAVKNGDLMAEAARRANIPPSGLPAFAEAFPERIQAFVQHLKSEGTHNLIPQAFNNHFKNWLPKRLAGERDGSAVLTGAGADEYLRKRQQLEQRTG